MTFRVPSDHPAIAGLHSDGFPLVDPIRRTVKAWRSEIAADGTRTWALRFAGLVWQVEDDGDPDTAWTQVTAFDPLQSLYKRVTTQSRAFTNVDGGTIARTLVDEANLAGPTGLTNAGGVIEQTPTRTVTYAFKRVGEALVELATAFNGFDLWLEPLDGRDGNLARLHIYARKGLMQPDVVLGWGIAPNNVKVIRRMLNGDIVANEITGLGSAVKAGPSRTQDSVNQLGLWQDVHSYSDITNQAYLDALVDEELRFRALPRELVMVVPQGGVAPEPFTHYNLGDLVWIYCGERLRSGFAGVQRVYGFDLSINSEGVEVVNSIKASPEG
jgi:hypothetical protein